MASEKRKQQAPDLSSGTVSIWNLLESALSDVPQARPANAATAREYAEKKGYSRAHAGRLLRDLADAGVLKPVNYLTESHKRGVC